MEAMVSSAVSPTASGRYRRWVQPIPCSPLTVPPRESLGLVQLAGHTFIEQNEWVQIAVTRMSVADGFELMTGRRPACLADQLGKSGARHHGVGLLVE